MSRLSSGLFPRAELVGGAKGLHGVKGAGHFAFRARASSAFSSLSLRVNSRRMAALWRTSLRQSWSSRLIISLLKVLSHFTKVSLPFRDNLFFFFTFLSANHIR